MFTVKKIDRCSICMDEHTGWNPMISSDTVKLARNPEILTNYTSISSEYTLYELM